MTIKEGDQFSSARPGADHYETFAVEKIMSNGDIVGMFHCAQNNETQTVVFVDEAEILSDVDFNWKPWDGVSAIELVPAPEVVEDQLKFGFWFTADADRIVWYDEYEACREAAIVKGDALMTAGKSGIGKCMVWNVTKENLMDYNVYKMQTLLFNKFGVEVPEVPAAVLG